MLSEAVDVIKQYQKPTLGLVIIVIVYIEIKYFVKEKILMPNCL